jgi:DNA mismatch endonuclease (patch repair protein)
MDRLTPDARRRLMQAVKPEHTTPELAVRSLLHRMGCRFRLHRRDLPGTPDIVLPGRGCVVFVNGCFWHGHRCRWGRLPKTRIEYWSAKMKANRERDRRKRAELRAAGWQVATVWQCELRQPERLEARLRKLLGLG